MVEGARTPLNGWQRAIVAIDSADGALMDPRKTDLIAALGETTGKHALQRNFDRMEKSPEGMVSLMSF